MTSNYQLTSSHSVAKDAYPSVLWLFQYIFKCRQKRDWLTFVMLMLWTNLFLLPAYIICSPGWQPGQKKTKKNIRCHVKRVSTSTNHWRDAFPTHWTGEDEAQRVGHTSVIVRVLVAVGDERWSQLRTQTQPGQQLYGGAAPTVNTESWERISGLSLRQLLPQVVRRNVLKAHRQTPGRTFTQSRLLQHIKPKESELRSPQLTSCSSSMIISCFNLSIFTVGWSQVAVMFHNT